MLNLNCRKVNRDTGDKIVTARSYVMCPFCLRVDICVVKNNRNTISGKAGCGI